jgi:hypothetical protein
MSKQAWHFGTPERDPAELAEESARRRAEEALERWARQPLSYNPINNPLAPVGQAPAGAPPGLLERAIANPRRRRTPARQRAAFLEQLARCGSVQEAALRAGVNRGTLYRWKKKDPEFAGRWAEAIRRRAEEVGDDIPLQANVIEVQPVFYRGQKIGEKRKVNTRLLMHVQSRLDTDRRRAEDRTERRELLLLRAELAGRSPESSQSATPAATAQVPEMCSEDLGLPAAA